jgi:hypothetical protein
MKNPKGRNWRKIAAALALVVLFALGFFLLGLFVDIQILLKYDFTPIPFTFTLPFVGALVGVLLALKALKVR